MLGGGASSPNDVKNKGASRASIGVAPRPSGVMNIAANVPKPSHSDYATRSADFWSMQYQYAAQIALSPELNDTQKEIWHRTMQYSYGKYIANVKASLHPRVALAVNHALTELNVTRESKLQEYSKVFVEGGGGDAVVQNSNSQNEDKMEDDTVDFNNDNNNEVKYCSLENCPDPTVYCSSLLCTIDDCYERKHSYCVTPPLDYDETKWQWKCDKHKKAKDKFEISSGKCRQCNKKEDDLYSSLVMLENGDSLLSKSNVLVKDAIKIIESNITPAQICASCLSNELEMLRSLDHVEDLELLKQRLNCDQCNVCKLNIGKINHCGEKTIPLKALDFCYGCRLYVHSRCAVKIKRNQEDKRVLTSCVFCFAK